MQNSRAIAVIAVSCLIYAGIITALVISSQGNVDRGPQTKAVLIGGDSVLSGFTVERLAEGGKFWIFKFVDSVRADGGTCEKAREISWTNE